MSKNRKIEKAITDERMKIIVVDSVKGGCGKTTIAIKYAAQLAKTKRNNVCLIDLDILGSCIETFITGKKFVGSSSVVETDKKASSPFRLSVENPALFYLNELFKGRSFSDRFFSKIKVSEYGTVPYSFMLIACSPEQDEKDLFKPSRLINYIGQIDYGYFAAMIKKMLSELSNMKYTHVIIDMPPNSDAYTDSVFDILLCQNEEAKDKIHFPLNISGDEKAKYNGVTEYDVEICIINALDRAHFEANLEWVRAMITERRMEWALHPELNFKFVFNNNSGVNEKLMYWKEDYFRIRSDKLNKLSICKITRFDNDRELAKNAMKDSNLEFGFLNEVEIYKELEK